MVEADGVMQVAENGHRLGACSVNSHCPGLPALLAASAAPATTRSGRPARSARFSTKSRKPFVSASRLSRNWIESFAISALISRRRFWPSAGSSAPPRTKFRYVCSSSVASSGASFSFARPSQSTAA